MKAENERGGREREKRRREERKRGGEEGKKKNHPGFRIRTTGYLLIMQPSEPLRMKMNIPTDTQTYMIITTVS